MKRQINFPPASYPDHAHSVRGLHMGNPSLYKPYADHKGIHCAGEWFGYIVEWQITEKKGESNVTGKAPH
ncbi:MAG: hypothetical protein AB2L24_16185 [Mangrovibacterium sp.]